jgi:phasin
MMEPKLEVPAELRDLAEKTIDQAEKAFGMFFDAANKSIASMPSPGTEMSKQALSLTEQNIKAAFEHARKLVHATDLQEAMRIQSEFLKSQFTMPESICAGSPAGLVCREGRVEGKILMRARRCRALTRIISLPRRQFCKYLHRRFQSGYRVMHSPSADVSADPCHIRQGFAYGVLYLRSAPI